MKTLSFLVLTAAVAACGAAPVPADKLARAQAEIRSAEVVRAERVPSASAHLNLAREGLQRATQLLKNGENEKASYELIRAEADAEAAQSLARETWAKQDAAQTLENVRQLKMQMEGPQS